MDTEAVPDVIPNDCIMSTESILNNVPNGKNLATKAFPNEIQNDCEMATELVLNMIEHDHCAYSTAYQMASQETAEITAKS